MHTTKPEVFIIESLTFEDERRNRFEGKIISSILSLNNKNCKYYYIRTKKEFKQIIEIFSKSQFRYLHISCHGNKHSIGTTLNETIYFKELGDMLKSKMNNKRLFLSACSTVNDALAKEIIPKTECLSVVGPSKDIAFHDAAIMWAALYHLMFKKDSKKMSRKNLLSNLGKVGETFGQPLNYYSKAKNKKGFNFDAISLNKKLTPKSLSK